MMAQQVDVFIVGASAHFVTPWGGPPVSGQAFDEEAIDTLIAAGNGDPFAIHAMVSASTHLSFASFCNRRLFCGHLQKESNLGD